MANHLNRSLKAVERYIRTFCRVVYCQCTLKNSLKTAMIVGISVPLEKAYWQFHCSLVEMHFIRSASSMFWSVERHWMAYDGKKHWLIEKGQEMPL